MEFKITKEQIDELAGTGTHYTERYLQSIFPEAFKTDLEVGKWYRSEVGGLWCISRESTESKQYSYGLNRFGEWCDEAIRISSDLIPATEKEIEATLIAEAKKRGYKKGQRIKSFILGSTLIGSDRDNEWKYLAEENVLSYAGAWVFKAGQWAEILPTEKTVVTREKALKILAKKLKVSPENIEIE